MSDNKKYNYDPSKIFSPQEELSKFIESKTIKSLVEVKDSENFFENKIIIGDGLEAMAAMEFGRNYEDSYKADIVMIDPPYNEDKSAGKYQDQWKGSGKNFIWAGLSHGAYLDYLHPRIVLGKNLLSEDGCMMLFIGDGEYHRVRLLMEMVFGEKNYLGTVVWDSSSNTQQSKKINRVHEYVIVFAKNMKKFLGLSSTERSDKDDLQDYANSLLNLTREERGIKYQEYLKKYIKTLKEKDDNRYKDIEKYKYLMPDTNLIFRDNSLSDPRSGHKTPMIHPITKKACTPPDKGYRVSKEYIEKLNQISDYYILPDGKVLKILENKNATAMSGVIFGPDEKNVPQSARYHTTELNKRVFKTTGYDFKTKDKKEGIPISSGFNTVKPNEFLTELILNYPKKNARILDYFGGSGTTAISVEKANAVDNGNRTWTLVEMNEETVQETMLPRLEYFNVQNYKLLKIEECPLEEDKLIQYFSNNLKKYLNSVHNYSCIIESVDKIEILGVEKNELIVFKQPNDNDFPRITKATRELKNIVNNYKLKNIKAYVINKEIISLFADLRDALKEEGIKLEITTVPDDFKKNWESNLSILTGEKR